MVRMKLSEVSSELSKEELDEIHTAEKLGATFDEDCPEMTAEQLIQFKSLRKTDRTKQTVSLRLSPETLRKAKKYGKGYTSFLSRLLDEAINNEALVRKCI